MNRSLVWAAAGVVIVVLGCALCLHQSTLAAPPAVQPPFANSIEQRMEMVDQLKEISAQLKEQNMLLREQIALLRSGETRVIVTLPPEVGK